MFNYPITFRFVDVIDILIVSVIIYYILVWIKGTRAVQLIRGVLLLLAIYAAGRFFGFYTINWLFEKFTAVILVLLIIIFQPELRRTLERFGRSKILGQMGFTAEPHGSWFIRHLVRAVEILSENKIGALLVLERNSGMTEFLESGVRLDAMTSAELIVSIFSPRSPLHDGAVIFQGERMLAAGCLLPLSESRLLDKRLGTRHRAAVGLTEQTDALVIVVSERTGTISVAENGFLTRFLTREMLEEKLFNLYKIDGTKTDIIPWPILKKKTAK
ncbi:MAG: diadenylate cyclase CdaA [Candidatus Margulisiibacteriota bacterium]